MAWKKIARRKLLAASVGGLVAGLTGPALLSQPAGAAGKVSGKMLTVYFSKSGVTRAVATQVQSLAGGDIAEIRPVTPYPVDYRETTDVAKREQTLNARPEITLAGGDVAPYDVIAVGYPNWWGTMPMALFTFFEARDFSGKTILPFCTHEGSRLGRSVADLRTLCPKASILEGLALRGGQIANVTTRAAQGEIAAWLADA